MPSLNFKGKALVQNYHLLVPYHELKLVKSKSLTDKPSLHDNLVVHGDNLKALKSLLPYYHGKVKCIYIDPPYNTGNENWVYNDNVSSPMMQEWLGKVVDREDLTRHDKWLCMMMPRLKLLREFLTDDGVIFASIDDNEVQHLRCLMDEVFSEANYRNTIAVKRGVKSVQAQFQSIDRLAAGHEYILCYSRNATTRLPKLGNRLEEEEGGKWDTFWRGTDRPSMRYQILGVEPKDGQWRWEKGRAFRAKANYEKFLIGFSQRMELDEYYAQHLTANREKLDFLRKSEDGVVQYYVPPRSYKLVSDNWLDISLAGSFTQFETEKSVEVVKRAVGWICKEDTEAIVLDAFAGSGTTGHAVLEMNTRDKGNRRFVLIEAEDFAEGLTSDRLRRVIGGTPGTKTRRANERLRGSFTFVEVGDPMHLESLLRGDKLPKLRGPGRLRVLHGHRGGLQRACCEQEDRLHRREREVRRLFVLRAGFGVFEEDSAHVRRGARLAAGQREAEACIRPHKVCGRDPSGAAPDRFLPVAV
jgi:DNA modification methylase